MHKVGKDATDTFRTWLRLISYGDVLTDGINSHLMHMGVMGGKKKSNLKTYHENLKDTKRTLSHQKKSVTKKKKQESLRLESAAFTNMPQYMWKLNFMKS